MLEGKGRLEFQTTAQMKESLNTLVRAGQHVLTELDINLKSLMALDFSQRGNRSLLVLHCNVNFAMITIVEYNNQS